MAHLVDVPLLTQGNALADSSMSSARAHRCFMDALLAQSARSVRSGIGAVAVADPVHDGSNRRAARSPHGESARPVGFPSSFRSARTARMPAARARRHCLRVPGNAGIPIPGEVG